MRYRKLLVRSTLILIILGGILPVMAWKMKHPEASHRTGCSCRQSTTPESVSTILVRMGLVPQGIIVGECPPGGADLVVRDTWCQRVFNSDCDGWWGSRADYLRARNKCFWDMGGYFLVTCGQWQPWDCCYEEEATPEPPCPRNRYQIYCVRNAPEQCP